MARQAAAQLAHKARRAMKAKAKDVSGAQIAEWRDRTAKPNWRPCLGRISSRSATSNVEKQRKEKSVAVHCALHLPLDAVTGAKL
jgi:hypothetical protein